MKIHHAVTFGLSALGALLPCSRLAAQETSAVESVLLKEGRMTVVQRGASLPMTNEIILPHNIKVMTNGAFRVQNGKERQLTDGQVVGADGILINPDGTLRPVFDHIAFVKGQALLQRDGAVSPLAQDTDLPDGTRITNDGYLAGKAGSRRKLLDGETFDLAGKAVPVGDTITMKDGKVIVQKDGTSLEVPQGRSLMMNDGSKVFGDGTVTLKNGDKTNLVSGAILKLEGVTPNNH